MVSASIGAFYKEKAHSPIIVYSLMLKSRNLTADTVLCSRLWRILDLISFIITFNYYRFYTVDQEGKRSYFSDEPEV